MAISKSALDTLFDPLIEEANDRTCDDLYLDNTPDNQTFVEAAESFYHTRLRKKTCIVHPYVDTDNRIVTTNSILLQYAKYVLEHSELPLDK